MKSPQEREEALFRAAAELPLGIARQAFLDQACAGDAALKQRLEALLAAHDQPDEVLAAPVPKLRKDETPTLDQGLAEFGSPDEAVGQTIGRYKLLEKVGEGGCGVVYVAEQTEPVRRRVALKVIKLGMDTKQVVARFEAERQALAMMDHPNIAKVLDAGTTESPVAAGILPAVEPGFQPSGQGLTISNARESSGISPGGKMPPSTAGRMPAATMSAGRPYFVMELVRGIRITDYCDQANLSTKERLDLFIKVCQAIQHAHQKGIIHRDIKPSNILVTLHDGVPVPKVIDFGIAKATEGRLTDATVYTQLHQFIGTPAYMSPEQAEMSGLDIDTRSDIYSLGVLLYELLAGSTPFDTKELMASGIDAMRKTIREVEPPRPSTRLSTLAHADLDTVAKARGTGSLQLRSQLRGDLDWIVMKALEKDRTRRYDTANGFAMDLRRHLADEPVTAGAPSAGYKFRKFTRRNKVAFAVAATIATVLIIATGFSVWQAVRATRAEALSKQRLTESEAITRFLTEVFQSPDPARDGRTVTVAETLAKAVKNLDTELADQPARRATLQATLGGTYVALGLYHEAIPLQEKARDYYLATSGPEDPTTLGTMHKLALSYFAAGRRDPALKLQEEVLTRRRKVLGPEHPDTLLAMNNLARSYHFAGRQDEALKLREEVLTLRRKVSGPEHLDTLMAMGNLAISYSDAGRLDEALKLREEVLTLRRKVSGPEHPPTLWAMGNLAISYSDAGRQDEALKLREEVLALRRKVSGPEHPDTLLAMNNLALSYSDTGRRDDALKLREELLLLCRKVHEPEHPDTLRTMQNLAFLYFNASARDEALKLREEVLTLRRKVLGPEHPETRGAMIDLAISYREAGRADEAINLGQSNLELHRRLAGPTNAFTLNAMTELAISYQVAGRTSEALALEEESLRLKRQHLPPGHPWTLESLDNLATCYEQSNRKHEAEALRRELAELKANKKPAIP